MRYPIGCAVLVALGVACGSAAAKDDPRCGDAVPQVQQYTAPGDTGTVSQNLQRALAQQRGGAQVDGWGQGGVAGSGCLVTFRYTAGNDRQQLLWHWDWTTGRVEARNDLTKRMSGW